MFRSALILYCVLSFLHFSYWTRHKRQRRVTFFSPFAISIPGHFLSFAFTPAVFFACLLPPLCSRALLLHDVFFSLWHSQIDTKQGMATVKDARCFNPQQQAHVKKRAAHAPGQRNSAVCPRSLPDNTFRIHLSQSLASFCPLSLSRALFSPLFLSLSHSLPVPPRALLHQLCD